MWSGGDSFLLVRCVWAPVMAPAYCSPILTLHVVWWGFLPTGEVCGGTCDGTCLLQKLVVLQIMSVEIAIEVNTQLYVRFEA